MSFLRHSNMAFLFNGTKFSFEPVHKIRSSRGLLRLMRGSIHSLSKSWNTLLLYFIMRVYPLRIERGELGCFLIFNASPSHVFTRRVEPILILWPICLEGLISIIFMKFLPPLLSMDSRWNFLGVKSWKLLSPRAFYWGVFSWKSLSLYCRCW